MEKILYQAPKSTLFPSENKSTNMEDKIIERKIHRLKKNCDYL
jgi:hypothetical protein